MSHRIASLSPPPLVAYAAGVPWHRMTRGILATALAWVLAVTLLAVVAPSGEAANRRFVGGWIPYWSTDENLQAFSSNAAIFSDVSPFWHDLTGDTTIADQEQSVERSAVIAAARAAGVPVVPAITDGMGKGKAGRGPGRSRPTLHDACRPWCDWPTRGATTASTWIWRASRTPTTSRPGRRRGRIGCAFVAELGRQLRARGQALHVTIPPTYDSLRSSTSGYWVYDYAGIAPHVDRVRLMAYDYSVSAPGPIAPYDWVQRIVRYAVTQIPAGKVVLGIPTYGRDWVTGISGTCPDGQEPSRRSLTANAAWALAEEEGATVRWDTAARERTFTYTQQLTDGSSTCGVARTVWFVDGSAVSERAQLYYRYGIGGVALWTVGGADAALLAGAADASRGSGPAPERRAGARGARGGRCRRGCQRTRRRSRST